jgi:hypothetical protein
VWREEIEIQEERESFTAELFEVCSKYQCYSVLGLYAG